MKKLIDWPLQSNVIRRGSENNTFGMVRRNADGTVRAHQGWDFYADAGTRCYAVGEGTIAHIRTVGDYGNTVVLQFSHDVTGDGNPEKVFAAYSHLSRIDVKVGDKVALGQQIGLTGNTGNAQSMTGLDQHLHFELRSVPTPGRGLIGRYSPMQLFGVCPMRLPIERNT
jgi:peptidoglycan LD-endopeptidase LytH